MDSEERNMKIIVTIGGEKKSGKDTLAGFIAEKLSELRVRDERVVLVTHFADYLKKMVCELFDVPKDLAWGSDEDKRTELVHLRHPSLPTGLPSVRYILQWFGTDVCRHVDDLIWIRKTLQEIRRENAKFSIIADQRFENELDLLSIPGVDMSEFRLYHIRISRPGDNKEIDTHASEQVGKIASDRFDMDVTNDGTLEELSVLAEALSGAIACSGIVGCAGCGKTENLIPVPGGLSLRCRECLGTSRTSTHYR